MNSESLYKTILRSPRGDDSSLAATAYLPNLIGSGGIDGPEQFSAVILTHNIKDSFQAKKAGAVSVDLTAAYDTVWPYRGLTCKLLGRLPEECFVYMLYT